VALSAACALASTLSAPSEARASCAAPATCICEEWPKAHVLHGSVRDSVGSTSQIEVHEVLAGAGLDRVSPGDVIEGVLDEPEPCGLSLGSFAPGDEVLALWQGKPPEPLECPEFADCAASRCAAWAAADPSMALACRSECVDEVRDACPSPPPRLVLVPWASSLNLGEGRTLAADAVDILADRWRCNAQLAGPLPACNDVVAVGVDDRACSAVSLGAASSDRTSSVAAWLIGFALFCASIRLRRAGRRSRESLSPVERLSIRARVPR
jgi:hypothetical protein